MLRRHRVFMKTDSRAKIGSNDSIVGIHNVSILCAGPIFTHMDIPERQAFGWEFGYDVFGGRHPECWDMTKQF